MRERKGRFSGFGHPIWTRGHSSALAVPATPCVVCFAFLSDTLLNLSLSAACTDGVCSFIHKGYTNFDLALHLQHVSERGGGRGKERGG